MNRLAALSLLLFLAAIPGSAQPYDLGSPVLKDLWVDPAHGADSNGGTSRTDALRTLTAAWGRIPTRQTLDTTGYRIQLAAGEYPEDIIPNYLESRWGTAHFPIIIQSADAARSAHLRGDLNIFDSRYLYLIGLDMTPIPAGDVVHCESCDHFLIRNSTLDGGPRAAHDMLKVNQSQWVYVESSTLSGADDNTIDFVAVQHGQVIDNDVSNAQDWCMYAKGGSAYLRIDGNVFHDCGTGGFTAGQGTGFQFMTSPWLHYEAYDIKVTNNVVHDTEGAGLGVNGGYNILLAFNTLYHVGARSHMLEVGYGNRSCDGMPGDAGRDRCQTYLNAGGWGTTVVDDGSNYVRIPSRNVSIYDNVLYNPLGLGAPQHFSIAGGYDGETQAGSNVKRPVTVDENLQIRGNIIWNPGLEVGLGIGDDSGCNNDVCNVGQVLSDNTINSVEPQFVNAAAGDYHPRGGGSLFSARTFPIPPFSWTDAPTQPAVPTGTLTNTVSADRDDQPRTGPAVPGAYATGAAPPATKPKHRSARH
jgi:Right handed beta helix region